MDEKTGVSTEDLTDIKGMKVEIKHLFIPFFLLVVGSATAFLVFCCELHKAKCKLI